MKLLALASAVTASHYRGGTYYISNEGNDISITHTQTWAADGNTGKTTGHNDCGASVASQAAGSVTAKTSCALIGGGSCTASGMAYVATFHGPDYCYGEGTQVVPKPSGPYKIGWDGGDWVDLTDDDGNSYSGDRWTQVVTVFDPDNNTPTFKHPPVWKIMNGCDGQTIHLSPSDADGDTVTCRWATAEEGDGAFKGRADLNSLTLNEETCSVTYDGSMDATTAGVKPIALMMEDRSADGTLRSMVPVQFLALVWTPDLSRNMRRNKNPYPNWFPDTEDHTHGRKRRSQPGYCGAAPEFVGDTPDDNAELETTRNTISFTLEAQSENGAIDSFSYQAPIGLTCTDAANGKSTCSWTLSDAQMQVEQYSFCFSATDRYGLSADRRCITIKVSQLKTYCTVNGNDKPEAWLGEWHMKPGCPEPTCTGLTVVDAWQSGKRNKRKYGFMLKIDVPQNPMKDGWTIALRFSSPRALGRGTFQTWNARFWNYYQKTDELSIALHEYWWADRDTVDTHSIYFVADQLDNDNIPSILFWDMQRVRSHNCFNGYGHDRAIANESNERIQNINSINKHAITAIRIEDGVLKSVRKERYEPPKSVDILFD